MLRYVGLSFGLFEQSFNCSSSLNLIDWMRFAFAIRKINSRNININRIQIQIIHISK